MMTQAAVPPQEEIPTQQFEPGETRRENETFSRPFEGLMPMLPLSVKKVACV